MIDLKGNTNYVAVKNLDNEDVPVRTNLSAVDMNVANGLHVEGDTLSIDKADPLELVTHVRGDGLVSADVMGVAFSFGRTSVVNLDKLDNLELLGEAVYMTKEDGVTTIHGIPITAGGIKKLQVIYEAPIPVISETDGLWLVTADVRSMSSKATQVSMNVVGTALDGYATTSSTPNAWNRLACLLNTNGTPYETTLGFSATFQSDTDEEVTFEFKNFSVVEVSDLELKYQKELASVAGTENAYMFKPGNGIEINDNTISTAWDAATVKETIEDSRDTVVGNKEFNGAISAGKAVDVTNMPSVSTGTLTTGITAMEPMTWTGASSGTIGFYSDSTKFPAYADGLAYLMLADVTNNGVSNVTISGTDSLNLSLPVVIPPGKMVRVAMMFTTATTGFFSMESTGACDLTFTKLRELEVTGCSQLARNYIASIEDPDDTDAYYLVDQDSVNPWLNMIDMQKSPVCLVQPGLAYKLFANDGYQHTLMVPAIKANKYGRSAYLELFVGNGSNVLLQSPLRLAAGNSFTDNTMNNCSVRFMDGIATLTVDSVESSYIVNLAGGTYTTETGTIYYGIHNSDSSLVIFNSSVDGLEANMNGAVIGTKSENKLDIMGNGLAETILIGSGNFGTTYTTTFDTLSFKDASLAGSKLTWSGSIGVINQLQLSTAVITVASGSTVVIRGSSVYSSAIIGGGTVTFGNGVTIDASQNLTGGIVAGSANSTISVPSGAVTFIGLGGVATPIVGSKSGNYLLADGSIASSLYTVNVTSGTTGTSSGGSLYYGLATTPGISYIVFSPSLDTQEIEVTADISLPTTGVSKYVVGNSATKTVVDMNQKRLLSNLNSVSTLSLTNLTIKNAATLDSNGAIQAQYFTTLRVSNCIINACYGRYVGGAVGCYSESTTYITGTTISGSTADQGGGGIAIRSQAKVTIIDSLICDNKNNNGNYQGGGLWKDGSSLLTITGSTFARNYCIYNGSHIFLAGGPTTISDTLFTDGSTADAGGICIHTDVTVPVTISGSTFATTTDTIRVRSGSTVALSGTNILNSRIFGDGYINLDANVVLKSPNKTGIIDWSGTDHTINTANKFETVFDGITFKNYVRSGGEGGAMLGHNWNPTFKDCTITGFTASHGPGAFYLSYDSHGYFENCTFTNNLGNYYGLILMQWGISPNGRTLDFIDCLVTGNTVITQLLFNAYDTCYAHVKGCTITGNTYAYGSSPWQHGAMTFTRAESVGLVEDSMIDDVSEIHVAGGTVTLLNNSVYSVRTSVVGSKVYVGSNTVGHAIYGTPGKLGDTILISGSTVDFGNTVITSTDNILSGVSVRICDEVAGIYTVGGTATVIYPGGSTVLSGIGTYCKANGTNDFSAPYIVTQSTGTASGSLISGLTGSAKYILMDYDVEDASATVTTALNNRVMNIMTASGDIILGGTCSIPVNAQVSVHVGKYENGVTNVVGSTVGINNGTVSLSGDCYLGGTFAVDTDCVVSANTVITGATGSIVAPTAGAWLRTSATTDAARPKINNVTFNNVAISADTGVRYIELSGCTMYGTTEGIVGVSARLTNCDIYAGSGAALRGDARTVICTNCTFRHGGMYVANAIWEFHNCTILDHIGISFYANTSGYNLFDNTTFGTIWIMGSSMYTYQKIIFKNIKINARMAVQGGTNTTEVTYLIAGSTINLSSVPAAYTRPIFGCAAGNGLRVGTFGTEFDFNTWTTGGTVTVITATGSTVHVSGTGTYINRDGTTDLTVV